MSKTIRGLSGMYFRQKDEETGKFTPIVFEDMRESEQDRHLEGRSEEWLKNLAKSLANTLNFIGEEFDIFEGEEEK